VRSWQCAYAHIFPADALGGLAATVGDRTERWRSGLTSPRPGLHAVVAELAGRVVGFSHFGPAREGPEGCGELYMIYVEPEAWSRGTGQALMARTLEQLAGDGYAESILWVLEDNPRTRRFYELAGWHADGEAKDEEWLGTRVREIRYRAALGPPA
jgi:GNAT superfamily N-acetyltransferase